MEKQEAFAIFEGGGAKGIALVGALKAIEEAKIQLVGWGGTSAGAIVAALAAVGWQPDALKQLMLRKSFKDFLDSHPAAPPLDLQQLKDLWERLGTLSEAIRQTGGRTWPLYRLWRQVGATTHVATLKEIARRLNAHKGLFLGDSFRRWISELVKERIGDDVSFQSLLEKKLQSRRASGEEDPLPEPLYVIATDHENKKAIVYGHTHRDISIPDAVRASMGIPFFFEPFRGQVDGGLISNFPSWVFDRHKLDYGNIPTIGVRLVFRTTPSAPGDLRQFVDDVFSSALEGKDDLDCAHRDDLCVVPVDVTDVGVGTFDFDVDLPKKEKLWHSGYSQTQAILREKRLGLEYDHSWKVFTTLVAELRELFDSRLNCRFNFFRVEGTVFRMVYHYNMDRDPDRRLVLNNNEGAVAVAADNGGLVLTDTTEPTFWIEDLNSSETKFGRRDGLGRHFLRDEVKPKVHRVKSIISHLAVQKEPNRKVGVFNIDCEHSLEDLGLIDSDRKVVNAMIERLRCILRPGLSFLH